MSEFYLILSAILLFDAALLGWLTWAFHAPRYQAARISPAPSMKVSKQKRALTILMGSTLSLGAIFGLSYLLFDMLFVVGPQAAWVILAQAAGVLVLYDVVYYFLHRGMHNKKLMRWVHGVHHRARNPSALESFYLHPVELLAGIFLLLGATYVVGPIHVYAFAIAFFVYSTLNILVHSGLIFDSAPMAPINALARKHHIHHMVDFNANYASLTPIVDTLLRTAR